MSWFAIQCAFSSDQMCPKEKKHDLDKGVLSSVFRKTAGKYLELKFTILVQLFVDDIYFLWLNIDCVSSDIFQVMTLCSEFLILLLTEKVGWLVTMIIWWKVSESLSVYGYCSVVGKMLAEITTISHLCSGWTQCLTQRHHQTWIKGWGGLPIFFVGTPLWQNGTIRALIYISNWYSN